MNTGMKLSVFFTQGFFLDPKYFPNLGSYVRLRERLRSTISDPLPCDKFLVYNWEMPEYHDNNTTALDPDVVISDVRADDKALRRDVLVSSYNESYEYIKRHEAWIKTLYARSSARLGRLDWLVVHIRLGDLSANYSSSEDDYIRLVCNVAGHTGLGVMIVSEDSTSPHSLKMESCLLRSGVNTRVLLKDTSEDTVQEDFDMMYRARAIVMGNSTFSWWAAFLNPFEPDVFVALSETRSPHHEVRKTLFENGPPNWHLYDMDDDTWLSKRPEGWKKRKRDAGQPTEAIRAEFDNV